MLDARPVAGDAEAARALPRKHAGGVELVEEPVTTEVAKAAATVAASGEAPETLG
jgi:hypothetical protein